MLFWQPLLTQEIQEASGTGSKYPTHKRIDIYKDCFFSFMAYCSSLFVIAQVFIYKFLSHAEFLF